jgi:hypothetical protein
VGDYAGDILKIPLWPSKALIPLGSLFLCLRFLRQIGENVVGIIANKPYGEDISLKISDE